MAIIDIIVIAVLVVFAIIGMWRGFINTILSLFSSVASIVVAIFAAKPVSKLLNSIFGIIPGIGGKIAGSLSGTITPFAADAVEGAQLTGAELKVYFAEDGLTWQERLYKLFIDDSKIFTVGSDGPTAANENIVQFLSESMAAVISVVIAAVVVFILVKLAVFLLSKLFNAITKNRAIGGLDRALGLLFGLCKAAVFVCSTLGIFYLIANSTVQGWIDNSTVTRWIYQYTTEFWEWVASKYDLPGFISGIIPSIT